MKYARIVNNKVNEVFTPPQGIDISECFHPDVVKQFVAVSDEVEAGWIFDGVNFAPPATD